MRSDLTELEQCVLGVIWRDGPMTAYEIAALFTKSLSPYWSGSAGAIYPVVQRLRKRGLVRGTRKSWNGAQTTVLAAVRAQYEKDTADGNESEAIGHLGVMYEVKARLQWLRAVRQRLAKRR